MSDQIQLTLEDLINLQLDWEDLVEKYSELWPDVKDDVKKFSKRIRFFPNLLEETRALAKTLRVKEFSLYQIQFDPLVLCIPSQKAYDSVLLHEIAHAVVGLRGGDFLKHEGDWQKLVNSIRAKSGLRIQALGTNEYLDYLFKVEDEDD